MVALGHRLYPFEGHTLDLDGLCYHYLDEGAGEPVLMLHGNPSWSFYYRDLVRQLRGDYRAIVPDHIGCGRSDKPGLDRYPYTLERRVADLARLIDHLDLQQPLTLVVHDWGGMIGFAYAVANAARIGRLVVLNTAAFHLPVSKPMPLALRLCRSPLGPLLVQGLNLFCRSAADVGCQRQAMTDEVRDGYLAPYDSWAHRLAVLRFVQDIPLRPGDPGYDLVSAVEEGLPRLAEVPLALFWGLRDFVFDEHFLAEWRRRFPNAEVTALADAGHYVLEDAAQQVIPGIVDFLARHPLADLPAGAAP